MKQKLSFNTKEYQQLISIFNSLDEMIYVTDPETYEILYINPVLKKTFGDVIGKKCYRVFQNKNKPCSFCTNKFIFGPEAKPVYIWEFQNKVNKRWYRCIDRPIEWIDGRKVRFELAIDITDKKLMEEFLLESQQRYRDLWDNAPIAYHIVDKKGIIRDVNKTELKLLGYSKKEMLGKPIFDFIIPSQREEARERFMLKMKGKKVDKKYDRIYMKKNGTSLYVSIHDVPEKNEKGEIIGMRTAMIDITELKKMEENLKEISLKDELTEVYNRRGFFTLAEQEIRRTQRGKNPFYILFIDFDNLKSINDKKGHLCGDEVLKKLGEILKDVFRQSDIIARIGGDEFVVLASDVKGSKEVKVLIDRMRKTIQTFNKGNNKYQISISIGTARYDGTKPVTIDGLLVEADRKMYQEKIAKYKLAKYQSRTIFDL
ncbi:MAG TPA: diguanylate cyclase [bacterium]|nr:diguanylate cyclase [bacterium]HOL49094.1 diguanylate cyclase [bacterium]HPO51712.1 diguanylate cyclase [bacterium]HXK45349.1 diguanylate cyclase [bacterium]